MISLITSAVNLSAITFHHHNANHNYSNTVNLQYPISTHNRYSQHLYYDDDTPNLHIGADISNVLNNDTSYIDLSSAISNFNGTYSSNETNFEDYTQIPYYIRATSMVFCIIIMCMGVIGNVMVPIVILKTKDMRNSTNIFLVNLSIADLMVLLVCTPTVLVEVNTKPETWVLGKELCLAVPFIELTVAHASVLTILAISFERYYAICEPLRAGYVCTKTRATLICALAWFVAAVFTSPILAIADHRKEKYQDGSAVFVCLTQATQFWPTMFFIMTISIFFFTPFVVLIILYTIIAKNLITASSKVVMNKHVDCLNSRARKQVILMLGTVVLCFFICLLPFRILMLYIIIVPDSVLANLGIERYYNILFFCRTMLYLNSAINPILYNLMSSKFRKGFFRLFCCAENPSEIRNYRRGYRMRTGTFNTTSSSYTTSSSVSRNTNSLKNAISKKISNADQSGTKIDDVSTNFSANRDGGLAREAHIASSQKRKELCKQNSDPHPTAIEPCAYENKYTNSTIYKVLKKSKFLRQRSDPINSHSESVENIISTSINKIMSVGNVCDEESAGSFDVSFKINNDTLKKSKVDHVDARFIADHRPVGRQRSLDVQNFRTNSLRRNVMLNSVKTKSFDRPDVEESLTLGEIVGPKSACVFKQSRCLNRAYPESYV